MKALGGVRSLASGIGFVVVVALFGVAAAVGYRSIQHDALVESLDRDADQLVATASIVDGTVVQAMTAVQIAQNSAPVGQLNEALAAIPVLPELISSITITDGEGQVVGQLLGAPQLLDPFAYFASEQPSVHPTMVAAAGDDPVVVGFVGTGSDPTTTVHLELTLPTAVIRDVADIDMTTAFEVTFGTGASQRTLLTSDTSGSDHVVTRAISFGGQPLEVTVWGESAPSLLITLGVGVGAAVLSGLLLTLGRRLLRDTRQIREDDAAHAALEMALTERRRGEMHLHSANARAQAVLNCVPDTIVALDGRDGRCSLLNRSSMFGLSAHELATHGFVPLVHAQDQPRVMQLLSRTDADGLSTKFRLYDRFGHERHVVLRVSSVVPGLMSGAPSHVAMLSDVTEQDAQREREATLRRAMQEAQHLEALGRLAGGIAHDFGNILSTVRIQAEVIEMTTPGQSEPALAIVQAIRSAEALIAQLLAFARRDVGEPVDVDVDAAIRSMEELIRTRAGAPITTTFELAGGVQVRADPSQIDQILLNLVGNACDAMPTGGVLSIRSSLVATGGDGLSPARLRLEISDTGTGMSPQVRARVFEPFYSTKGDKGTGLGLATVHSIITEMGGTIRVDSEQGIGTTFVVQLPVSDPMIAVADTHGETEFAGLRAWISTMAEDAPDPAAYVELVEPEDTESSVSAVLAEHGYRMADPAVGGDAVAIVVDARDPDAVDAEELISAIELWPRAELIVIGIVPHSSELSALLRDAVVLPASPFRAEKLLLALAAIVGVARS